MTKKVVAVVGSYRKGGIIDSTVDAILDGARQNGAETQKIYLLDKHIEFCTNCRSCTQLQREARGICVHKDDMESVLCQIAAADSLVLGAPVNFYNVTAIFRRFMERLVSFAYWPWEKRGGPVLRNKVRSKKAALITSAAMPGFLIPISTGAPRALRTTAEILGATPVAKLWLGLSAIEPKQRLSEDVRMKANRIGRSLA